MAFPKKPPQLLSKDEILKWLRQWLEAEDDDENPLRLQWDDGYFPANCDDSVSFTASLSLLRETPLEEFSHETSDGSVLSEIDEVVLLYKSLYELTKGNTGDENASNSI